MIAFVEAKDNFNWYVFPSVASEFIKLSKGKKKGALGDQSSAAMLMWLAASDDDKQRFLDAIKMAEGRSVGNVYKIALGMVRDEPTSGLRIAARSESRGKKKP